MIERSINSTVEKYLMGFPVVAITGPRQSGKTTFLKKKFPEYQYFNLEDPDIFNIVQDDMGGFIKQNRNKMILDEVQKLPELLSYIQAEVDNSREMGRFILSGSENLLLSQRISQTLAGRAAYVNLFPLTVSEYREVFADQNFRDLIFQGFYPAVFDRNIDPIDYYNQYIATYVERDVRQIVNIQNTSLFRKFLGLLAGRVGSVVNYASLSNDVGVDAKTIESWISILEATFVIFRVPPFFENFGKRHIKSPKIYFTDTGVACRLLGVRTPDELRMHSQVGALFENLVIANYFKENAHRNIGHQLYFYHENSGNEVDLLLVDGENITPIEIKSSSTWNKSFTKGLVHFLKIAKGANYTINTPSVVYNGPSAQIHDISVRNFLADTEFNYRFAQISEVEVS
jgi:predicted AAA+ superfamily ATPase